MDKNNNMKCSFCGKSRKDAEKLVAGPEGAYICDECVELCHSIIDNDKEGVIDNDKELEIPDPKDLHDYLNHHVIGQEQAKKVISVAVYNHYKILYANKIIKDNDIEIEKSNVLMLGPSGVGKTLIAKKIADYIDVPFAIGDATTLTEAGYVGEDAESVLERLIQAANGDITLAEKGIVFIDEVDKKARKSESNTTTRDVSGEGVQQALLRLIEGTQCKIKTTTKSKYTDEFIEFDTSNVMFILGGAFVGIDKIIEKRLKSKSKIGFNSKILSEDDKNELLTKIRSEDVVHYGIIPELVGRLPVIATMEHLSKEQLRKILTDVKNNVIMQVKSLLRLDNLDIVFTDNYYKEVSEISIKSKMGARALKSIVENSLINIMFRIDEFNKSGVHTIRFDNYPYGDKKPILIFDDREELDTKYKIYRGIDELEKQQ